jgi:hypothetical protein
MTPLPHWFAGRRPAGTDVSRPACATRSVWTSPLGGHGSRPGSLAMRRLSLLLLSTTLLAGCSGALGGGSEVGSLGTLDPDTYLCTPLHRSTSVLEGSNVLRNSGKDPVTITKVELVGAQGLTLTKAELGPILHRGRTTYLQGLMPARATHTRFAQTALSRAVPAVGATLQPRQSVNLLLFVAQHGMDSPSRMDPPKVTYTENSATKVWHGGQVDVLPRDKCQDKWLKDWQQGPS